MSQSTQDRADASSPVFDGRSFAAMSDEIGTRLRAAREEKGLSLRALAAEIGVSPSLLSQVETGKTKPSVSTLYALVSKLDISTDMLLGREEPAPRTGESPPAAPPAEPLMPGETLRFQPEADAPTLEMDNGVKWERLAMLKGTDMEALRVTYSPGGASSIEGHLMRHFGIEHVYLISGELTLKIDFETHLIKGGDSIVFDSRRPHLFVNESAAPAIGVWYITGRKALAAASGNAPLEQPVVPTGPINSMMDVLKTFRS